MREKLKYFLKKIRNKYRLVIYNDVTLEESVSLRLSRLNVFLVVGTLGILLVFFTTYIIAFTPLKEYIPGYGSLDADKQMNQLIVRTDSLEKALQVKTNYVDNIRALLRGEDVAPADMEKPIQPELNKDTEYKRSKEDSILRADIESQPAYNLSQGSPNDKKGPYSTSSASISGYFFFAPLNGTVTNNFDPAQGHYGVDIVASRNEAVKATLDGTVLLASWTLETGYTIVIQHTGNLMSVYKHNSVLLKKQGDYVKAGEVVAIIGETGLLSSGIHLHFEIWFNGIPVNPRDYIIF